MVWLHKTKIASLYTYDIYNMIIDDIYKDVGENVELRFDTSNYELDRPLALNKWWNKKLIELMKNELCGNLMKEFFGLRANWR